MRVGLATDHGGFELKEELVAKLKAAGIPEPKDLSVIFDPRASGHVTIPDVSQTNWTYVMPTLAAFFGNSLDNPTPTLDKYGIDFFCLNRKFH